MTRFDFVRLTYLLGALVDALAGVQLLLPPSVTILGFRGLRGAGPAGHPAVTGGVLMFGFTAILLWAHGRPVPPRPRCQRRGGFGQEAALAEKVRLPHTAPPPTPHRVRLPLSSRQGVAQPPGFGAIEGVEGRIVQRITP